MKGMMTMDATIELGDHAEILINAERLKANNMRTCHSHGVYELYYLIEGNRILLADGSFYLIRKGDLFLIPPGMRHRTLDENGGYEKLVIMLPCAFLPKDADRSLRIVRPTEHQTHALKSDAEEILRRMYSEDFFDRIHCLSAVMRLMLSVFHLPLCNEPPVASPALGKVSAILSYMEENYMQKITVSSLAERFFISDYYLCRIFKAYTGRTVNEYLSQLCVEAAEHLLLQGASLHNVWRGCGFGSESSFARVFRQKNGCSAGQFVRQNGKR
jgi:AraC-like DNA-binding protein